MAKVWSKRFDNALDPFIEKFNASIGFDKKNCLDSLMNYVNPKKKFNSKYAHRASSSKTMTSCKITHPSK